MENKEKFINNLKEILFESSELDISLESKFRDFDEWDSLIGMAIQVMLKDQYDVDLKTEIFKSFDTVGDIFEFINKK